MRASSRICEPPLIPGYAYDSVTNAVRQRLPLRRGALWHVTCVTCESGEGALRRGHRRQAADSELMRDSAARSRAII
eukprot:127631-Rhodomonas_salina.1